MTVKAVSSTFHFLQHTLTKGQLNNVKKFACRKINICILRIIPKIKSVICFTLLLDFHTYQCCLYHDGKKPPQNSALYSYLAWIWHTVRSAVKRNFWFILIPVSKNHSWVIWPFEQGWYIFIPETHPYFFFSICNLKWGQRCGFKIKFNLIGKEYDISKIRFLSLHCTVEIPQIIFFSYSKKGHLRQVQCILVILFLNLNAWIRVSFREKITNKQTNPEKMSTQAQKLNQFNF